MIWYLTHNVWKQYRVVVNNMSLSLNISVLQFPHLWNGFSNSTHCVVERIKCVNVCHCFNGYSLRYFKYYHCSLKELCEIGIVNL